MIKSRKRQNKKIKKLAKIGLILLKIIFFLFFPFVILFLVEYIGRQNISDVIRFLSENFFGAAFSYLIYLLFFLLFYSLFLRFSFFIVPLFFTILALINFFKRKILDEPFYPIDLIVHSGETKNLLNFVNLDFNFNLSIFLILIILILYFLFFKNYKINFKRRSLMFLLAFSALLYLFVSADFRNHKAIKMVGPTSEKIEWRQDYNYDKNGFLLGFYLNLSNIFIEKPEGYSEDEIKNTIKHLKKDTQKAENDLSKIKPDVVVILSEAFWDITRIKSLSFREDPLKFFHSISKDFTSGNLVSPVFGGKTALVEYEILTGNMTKLLPIGSIPYTQYVNKKLPSIVWEFKNNGYSTKAIHTFEKKFFNRNNAYPFLGFDKFIAVEDMEYPTFKGPFVSDDYFVNEIIYNLKTFQDKPNFIFGISMQNHFSYEGEKYKKDEINVEVNSDKLLSEKNRKILTNYTQGISDADKSLEKLISYLKSREKPTIVLFFGDHLGTMGDNYETYRETGYIKSKSTEKLSIDEISSIHLTPFLIWDNLGIKKQNLEKIPAYYLGNHLLDYFNFNKKSRYFENMDYLYKDYLKNPGNNDLIKKHHLLQYDMFFGENFLEKIGY